MTPTDLRPLSFGEILDGAFSLYRRHFATLFVTALIPTIPLSLLSYELPDAVADPARAGEAAGLAAMLFLVMPVGFAFMWAALTHQFAQAVLGRPFALGEAYARGGRALLPVLVAGVIFVLLLVPVLLLTVAVGTVLLLALGSVAAGGVIAGSVLTMLLVLVVTAIGGAAFFAVVPAVVVEGKGPWAALKRSWALARGAWLRIMGVFLIAWLITVLPTLAVLLLTGEGAALMDPTGASAPGRVLQVAQQVGSLLVSALTAPYYVGALVVLYFDRRVRTEAFDLELATEQLSSAN